MSSKKKKTGRRTSRAVKSPCPAAGEPRSREHPAISELTSVAAALIGLPGTVIYLTVLMVIVLWPIRLAGNVMAPLLLGCIGLGLMMLSLCGLIAGAWRILQSGTVSPVVRLCVWANGSLLAGMILLALLMPQLE